MTKHLLQPGFGELRAVRQFEPLVRLAFARLGSSLASDYFRTLSQLARALRVVAGKDGPVLEFNLTGTRLALAAAPGPSGLVGSGAPLRSVHVAIPAAGLRQRRFE